MNERKQLIVEHINPGTLHKNPAFTNVISVTGPAKTIYVGGQNAVDQDGNIIGKGNLKEQSTKILQNIETALQASGARIEDVVKWNLNIVAGQPLQDGFAAFQEFWGNRGAPPTITVLFVSGLAHPDFLAEMDAVAVVAE